MTAPTFADRPDSTYSQEAEEATIGSILINPPAFHHLAGFLDAEDFFLLRHQYIWQGMELVLRRNEPIDPLTVSEALDNMGLLNDIGGTAYLVNLINKTPTSVYAEVYGRIVERTSIRRRLLEHADNIRMLAQDEEKSIEDVVSEIGTGYYQITANQALDRGGFISEDLEAFDAMVKRQIDDDSFIPGEPTGFRDLDTLYQFTEGNFIVIAGRPGMGKSALILNIMLHILRTTNKIVPYFSMEMTRAEILKRLLVIMSGIPQSVINNPRRIVQSREYSDRFQFARMELDTLKHQLYVDDTPAPKPNQIRMTLERLMIGNDVSMGFIDGMYRMQSDYDTRGNDHQRFGQIAQALKTAARDLKIPIMAAHQLNRNLENRANKRPQLSDLRESGKIEEEADKVLFIYRDCIYDDTADPHRCEIICGKHRDGAQEDTVLHFEGASYKFSDATIERIDTYERTDNEIDL